MDYTIRIARSDDLPGLENLIALSARELGRAFYTSAQIESALGSAWGVDSQLISDETYFVVESENDLVACGGWSKRKALFGADAVTRREPELLNPAIDAARIRAFFVHPRWARKGVGKTLLKRCEAEAMAAGFRKAELVATLPGEKFYQCYGYVSLAPFEHRLPNGCTITFVPMKKGELVGQ